ncbi:hypothetical protein [Nocardioides sp. zg-1228]|uniref:hypothetical protein n=1 Tax=Nocardioides sp. zg-1228 TaxID=2763008 RepID=UPI0016427320|nr:hypothetical protein [Nocardioides sp. zg-1228]MBC2934298.1 hypothetical protein [Nocardioides sp. zg-1228]QSF59079.1 hypothetical protein JX575_07895 [Nocardioides sp. zg-1228]
MAVLIERHLDLAEFHHKLAIARGDRTPGNLYDLDRAWCARTADIDSILPAFVSAGLLEAARHHLRGMAALLPLDGIDIALSALARGCCEASARAVAVLDPDVEPQTRASRALNDALHSLRRDSVAIRGDNKGALLSTARRLDIPAQFDKSGHVRQFGDEPRPSMTSLTREYLTSEVNLLAEAFEPFWRLLNGAAHGGLDAGLGLGFGGGNKGFAGLRISAGLMSMTACGVAHERALNYQGLPGLSTALPQ